MISHLRSNRFELVSAEMSFTDDFGLSFNCGFCRTLVYKCLSRKGSKGGKKNEKVQREMTKVEPVAMAVKTIKTIKRYVLI